MRIDPGYRREGLIVQREEVGSAGNRDRRMRREQHVDRRPQARRPRVRSADRSRVPIVTAQMISELAVAMDELSARRRLEYLRH